MITRRNVFTVLLLACATQASAAVETPAGDWRTFDDHTGLERSLIRIEVTNGVLTGRVVSTIDPVEATHTCDKCEDDRYGKRANHNKNRQRRHEDSPDGQRRGDQDIGNR